MSKFLKWSIVFLAFFGLIFITNKTGIFKTKGNIREKKQKSFYQQRINMVKTQIISRGIKDKKVLMAMKKVSRHKFVPKNVETLAYRDHPLPIGKGQTISQPYIVALMTELLELKSSDKVLEIGTGSGYQAAVLAEIAKEIFTIEIIEELGTKANAKLEELGYKNVEVKIGDGFYGWPEKSPFDAIIVTCAVNHIPLPLVEQLNKAGRMVIPVGERFSIQNLVLVRKNKKGEIQTKKILPVRFVPMLGDH